MMMGWNRVVCVVIVIIAIGPSASFVGSIVVVIVVAIVIVRSDIRRESPRSHHDLIGILDGRVHDLQETRDFVGWICRTSLGSGTEKLK